MSVTTRRSSRKSVNGKKAPPATVQNLVFSRDESWMRFNQRVLEEAQDETNPLLERVKFLSITGSNLDEFLKVRRAGVFQRIEDGSTTPGPDGMPPEEELELVTKQTKEFAEAQQSTW